MCTEKVCSKCKITKTFESFYKQKDGLYGLRADCKECHIAKQKTNVKIHSTEVDYSINIICTTCHENKNAVYFYKSKKHKNGFYPSCKSCTDKKNIRWKENNREELKIYRNEYSKKRKLKDPLYKLARTSRALIYNSFKRFKNGKYKKAKKTEEILGCTIEEFIEHLQSLFTQNMTLSNNGNCEECWHIDHKIPLSSGENEEDIIKLCHYTNLQPMWSRENLSKNNKQ